MMLVRPRVPAWMLVMALAVLAGCGQTQRHADRGSTPVPALAAVDTACRAEILRAHGLQVEAQDCRYSTGRWRVRADDVLPGFALWRDDQRVDTVIHILRKPADAPLASVLPALAERALVPPDDCVFVDAAARYPVPDRRRHHEIRPQGRRLAQLLATPADQVPDPPCGEYGASTHGVRYFVTDVRHPTRVLYVNLGQDGTQIAPSSIRIIAAD